MDDKELEDWIRKVLKALDACNGYPQKKGKK